MLEKGKLKPGASQLGALSGEEIYNLLYYLVETRPGINNKNYLYFTLLFKRNLFTSIYLFICVCMSVP